MKETDKDKPCDRDARIESCLGIRPIRQHASVRCSRRHSSSKRAGKKKKNVASHEMNRRSKLDPIISSGNGRIAALACVAPGSEKTLKSRTQEKMSSREVLDQKDGGGGLPSSKTMRRGKDESVIDSPNKQDESQDPTGCNPYSVLNAYLDGPGITQVDIAAARIHMERHLSDVSKFYKENAVPKS